jgi:hypothetical protein
MVASGVKFSDDGLLEAVDDERRLKLAGQLRDFARDSRPEAEFIRWFFSSGKKRTIFPASDIKIVDWVENTIQTNSNLTEQWLRNALIFFPDHPLLHIALAGFESDPKRADFLRSFGLARLPKQSQDWVRAGEMLFAQHRPDLALVALDNALAAHPADATVQNLRLKVLEAMPH